MDILNLVNSGAQFKVEVSSYDLTKFAEDLIKKAMEEQKLLDAMRQSQASANPAEGGEVYLTVSETAKMCNVCGTTLYSWAKAGYLVPCKIGRSKRYALSDIQKLLANHSADASKAKEGYYPKNKAQQALARQAANKGL